MNRQSVVCLFGDSLAIGGPGALGLSDDRCAGCVSVDLGQYRRRGRPNPACFRHEGVCSLQGRGATIKRRVKYWGDILGARAKERRDRIAVKPSAADHPKGERSRDKLASSEDDIRRPRHHIIALPEMRGGYRHLRRQAPHRCSTFGFHGSLHEELSLTAWVLQMAQKWPEIPGSKIGGVCKTG